MPKVNDRAMTSQTEASDEIVMGSLHLRYRSHSLVTRLGSGTLDGSYKRSSS